MSKDYPSSENSKDPEYEVAEEERRRFNHSEIRLAAKDLRIVVGQTPESFPQRQRLFEIADEILRLVPVYNQEDEERDENRRRQMQDDIRTASDRWEEQHK